MHSFLFSHIRSHLFRSISMFLISSISIIVIVILLFCYQNIAWALSHYSYDIVDEHRFTLRSDSNLFSLFAKSTQGLPSTLVSEIESSNRFEKVQSFSLVELPVVAKFSLFSFGLETDIPVFSVTDSALSGSGIPVGISRSMLDFYNLQFAGSSQMFPKVNEKFLLGQTVRLTFGASKIFPSLPTIATPIEGTIVEIGNDFPGFGLVIPESIVRSKMQEVGYALSSPYKIVAYMKDIHDMQMIREKYAAYSPEFDIDAIAKIQAKIIFFRNIFLSISLFLVSIFCIFFIILLFSFFRERRDVFRMMYIFGLSSFRARILTLWEPIILLLFGSIFGVVVSYFSVLWFIQRGTVELMSRGIGYILVSPQLSVIFSICLAFCIIFSGAIIILEYMWRKKALIR